MPRVITSVTFNLQFDVRSTPPATRVLFTDKDEAGRETHGSVTLTDDVAAGVWPKGLLESLNAAIDGQAALVAEPGSVAERITMANEADMRLAMLNAQIDARTKALKEMGTVPSVAAGTVPSVAAVAKVGP